MCIKIDLFEFLIFMFYVYELFISFLFYIGEIESYFGKGGGEEGFLDIKKVGGLLYILSDKKSGFSIFWGLV